MRRIPNKTIAEDVRTAFREDPAARNVLEVLTCYPGLHAIWIAGKGGCARIRRNRTVTRRNHRLKRLAFMLEIPFGGLNQVGDQVVAPPEFGIDVRPRFVTGIASPHESIVPVRINGQAVPIRVQHEHTARCGQHASEDNPSATMGR